MTPYVIAGIAILAVLACATLLRSRFERGNRDTVPEPDHHNGFAPGHMAPPPPMAPQPHR